MRRFTGHTEPWGAFLDVKNWPEIKKNEEICRQGTVYWLGYSPLSSAGRKIQAHARLAGTAEGKRRKAQHSYKKRFDTAGFGADTYFPQARVSWSVNTLDEGVKNDMDSAASIGRRLAAIKGVSPCGRAEHLLYFPRISGHYRCKSNYRPGKRAVQPDLAGKPQPAGQLQNGDFGVYSRKNTRPCRPLTARFTRRGATAAGNGWMNS